MLSSIMNALDVVIALLVVLCALYGLWKGFVRIAVGVSGFAISLAFALRLSGRGPAWFGEIFASAQLCRLAAFVLVCALGLIVTAAVAFLAHKIVKSAQISWLDRLVGAGIGAVGATLLVCGLLVGVTAFLPPGAAVLEDSLLVPYAIVISDLAASILPPEMAEIYAERRRELDRRFHLSGEWVGAPQRRGEGATSSS